MRVMANGTSDLQALIDACRGDVRLIHLKFRCSNCGGRLTDFVCTSKDAVRCSPGHPRNTRAEACRMSGTNTLLTVAAAREVAGKLARW
jgi:hypothetical protein